MIALPSYELQLDGLVGPTHNYAGLSWGNRASEAHGGQVSYPRKAALEGLRKMRLVARLGVKQGLLPPHERPLLSALRRWGFSGTDEEMLAAAWSAHEGYWVRLVSSASAMWTANAATLAPSSDTRDGKVHMVVANLASMAHRSLEPQTTERVLRIVFGDEARFSVHSALPGGLALGDEGAANHTRLVTSQGSLHLFAWGRRASVEHDAEGPGRSVARQTLEASSAVVRLLALPASRRLFPRQEARGIDAGAFHSDVLAVGNGCVFLVHELAFANKEQLFAELTQTLGPGLRIVLARDKELPVSSAVHGYPFNSQILTLPDGTMTILAPAESEEDPACRSFLQRVIEDENPIQSVQYVDLRQSMQNGGGPACLRLRVPLTSEELGAMRGRILVDDTLLESLEHWVCKHYREQLAPADLGDPQLARESMAALDELTQLLQLGSLYDFQ